MKKTILALTFVAATLGAFSQTKPVKSTATVKPAPAVENKAAVAKAAPTTKMVAPEKKHTAKKVKSVKRAHRHARKAKKAK